ncbi:RNB domain-containing ribonuclease [Brachybacterium hainanense]|uniref:RNB domain-containing ribonuclease n=1 Tax=Brachybacterium hainanense TaxID=1541174 RepID=A0ABV6RBG8_9MICO
MHRPIALDLPRGSVAAETLSSAIDELLDTARDEVPTQFPPEVLAAAEDAARRVRASAPATDLRDIPFVTLDPASSTDLDQAMHLHREQDGFRVRYAIADVPLFVELDGVLDAEARRRGATLYLPDRRIPLHPPVLSEGAASLLPGQDAPAFVWDMHLDARGELISLDLVRALVRSREKLDYEGVQRDLDAGSGHPQMQLLQEIGALRAAREAERGGASLSVPEQEARLDGGAVRLDWRRPQPVEDANAQLSLLTGMAAADLMLEGGSGILRIMPPAQPAAIERFRRQCTALGVTWPEDMPYGRLLRSLDWREGRHLALLNQAASLFRGASYAAFTRPEERPEDPRQAAIAAPYAHATAPLRRLVDRFVLLVCHAHAQGRAPEPELLAALAQIPPIMQETVARAGSLERSAIDLLEAEALRAFVGEQLPATVIEVREAGENAPARVEVQLAEPPVTAWVPGSAPLGEEILLLVGESAPGSRMPRLEMAHSA